MDKNQNITLIKGGLTVLLSLLVIVSLASNKRKDRNNMSLHSSHSIQQKTKDLLAGVSSAVCYSGFRTGQHPDRGDGAKNPTKEQVLEDLQIINKKMGFKLIRLYDSGKNSEMVLQLIQENKLDIKVMLGIWLNAELSAHETCAWLTEPIPQNELDQNKIVNQKELEKGKRLAKQIKKIVVAVNVGNEALVDWNDHKMHVDTVISYCKRVKNAIVQPVTVADNYEWWAAHGKKLAAQIDFISVHVYPVWEGKPIEEGLSYSVQNIQKVRNALPESKIVISEAGWATVSSEFPAQANENNQKQYYNELISWAKKMNITTFFFEAFDEDWKGDPNNPLGAEKHWGLYTVNRKPKLVMQ